METEMEMDLAALNALLQTRPRVLIYNQPPQSHCLFPKCDRKAPPFPASMLLLCMTDRTSLTDSSGVLGPLKCGAYFWNFSSKPPAILPCCSGVTERKDVSGLI
jgi:hypothetical protein